MLTRLLPATGLCYTGAKLLSIPCWDGLLSRQIATASLTVRVRLLDRKFVLRKDTSLHLVVRKMGGKLIDFRLIRGTWYIEQVEKLIQSPLSASLQHVSLPKTQLPRRKAHCESPKACRIVYEPYKIRLSQIIPLDLVRPAHKPIGCRGASLLQ